MAIHSQMTQTQFLARLIAIGLCAGAGVFVILFLGEDAHGFDQRATKMVGAAFFFSLFAIAGAPGARLAQRRDSTRLSLLGVLTAIVAVLAFGSVATVIWNGEFYGSSESFKVATIATMVALAMGFASLLLGSSREGDGSRVRTAQGGAVAALALLIALIVIEMLWPDSVDISVRWHGILATAFVLGSALTPLLRVIEAPAAEQPPSQG